MSFISINFRYPLNIGYHWCSVAINFFWYPLDPVFTKELTKGFNFHFNVYLKKNIGTRCQYIYLKNWLSPHN